MADENSRAIAIFNGKPNMNSSSDEKKAIEDAEKKQKNDTTISDAENTESKDYIENYYQDFYLRFGKKVTEEDALSGREKVADPYGDTLKFLTDVLKCDGGELRQARENKEKYKEAVYTTSSIKCAYCFMPLSGAEYDVLADGRKRCPACSRSLIKAKEDVENIFKRTLENFRMYFDAIITSPINVVVLNEKKLKRKMRKTIDGSIPENGIILGCAVRKRVKKQDTYTIFLENGAPRISVISTIAHELTHIWQYEQEHKGVWKPSNYQGIIKDPKTGYFLSNLEICEGMAMWTEIQFLYIIGEEKYADRRFKMTEERMDEYGRGFRGFVNEFNLQTSVSAVSNHPFSAEHNQDSKMERKKKED